MNILYHIWYDLSMRGMLNFLSDESHIKTTYRIKLGHKLNLKNPQRFTEKIQWLKLYNHDEAHTPMVDKYLAKKYVESKIGEKYITPTIAVYNNFSEIDIDSLPDKFVLKCTHDSGGLVICRDKSKLEWGGVKLTLESCLKRDFYKVFREWPYKNVKPRIIAEEYMENDSTEGLHDYKVWCFNGKAVYVQYITGRIGESTYEGFYDKDWNLQPFSYHNPVVKTEIPKPSCLDELFRLASILAEGMPFVRIDFYILPNNSIRFGEITFFPMAGIEHFHPDSADLELGRLIDLTLVTNDNRRK